MPELPVLCESCGTLFGSGMVFENSTNITLSSVTSRCPKCGAAAHVPDGVYDFVGDSIRLLRGPETSVDQLKRLAALLESLNSRRPSPEESISEIRNQGPIFAKLADLLPQDKNQLYAFITLLLTALTVLIGLKSSGSKAPIDIDVHVEQVITQVVGASNTPQPPTSSPTQAARVGRNDPCPCGSGKKFKKCHGANN